MGQQPVSRRQCAAARTGDLPPGDPAGRPRLGRLQAWRAGEEGGVHRIDAIKVGPFGFFLMALALGAIAAVILTFIVGAFLIAIPLAGLVLAAAVLSGMWRGSFRRAP